jgi:hypothetical protein
MNGMGTKWSIIGQHASVRSGSGKNIIKDYVVIQVARIWLHSSNMS